MKTYYGIYSRIYGWFVIDYVRYNQCYPLFLVSKYNYPKMRKYKTKKGAVKGMEKLMNKLSYGRCYAFEIREIPQDIVQQIEGIK